MCRSINQKHPSHTGVAHDGRFWPALVAAAAAAFLLLGCKTHSPSQYVSPRVEGRVIDSNTHQPIAGVQVRRVTPQDEVPPMDPVKGAQLMQKAPGVHTGEDGAFALDSVRAVALFRKLNWFSVGVAFEHPGYVPLTSHFSYNNATNTPTGEPVVHTGDIQLSPLAE
jgi:hypothetical protein